MGTEGRKSQPRGPAAATSNEGARARRRIDGAEAERHLRAVDPVLRKLVERVGPFRPGPKRRLGDTFTALTESVVYQQLTGKAAATILGRVVALFPPPFPTPEALLAAPDEALRGAGLSRGKIAALRDLAAKVLDGTVPDVKALRRMEDEAIIARLTEVRGIGRWSVEMLLQFRLERPDVLAVNDYGIRKGYMITFRTADLPHPKVVAARGERWRPHRSVASWYLWRAVDLSREKGP